MVRDMLVSETVQVVVVTIRSSRADAVASLKEDASIALVEYAMPSLDDADIDAILDDTRIQGYAVRDAMFGGSGEDISEFDDGFDAIAVPVLGAGGVLACINLVWPRRYGLRAKVVDAGSVPESALWIHDEGNVNAAKLLADLFLPDFPVPVGVLAAITQPIYEDLMIEQERRVISERGPGKIASLLTSGDTWKI